jgi:hypothetical protein
LWSPIQRRFAKTQNGLALVRAREVADETRTKIVNAVRGIVKSSGHRLPTSPTSSSQGDLSGGVEATLLPLLRVVEDLTREVGQAGGAGWPPVPKISPGRCAPYLYPAY